ncbi:MAG: hypothetical protein ACC635_03810 [Acidiferrobacterales bacterium]
MLNYFRKHSLRKSLWLIILFGSLLTQAQNLYACDLTDSGLQSTCCCDKDMDKGCSMGGGCDVSAEVTLSGCCEVSTMVDVGLQDVARADSLNDKLVLLLDAPQPPPAIITSKIILPLRIISESSVASNLFSIDPLTGTHTYLVTQRFRV